MQDSKICFTFVKSIKNGHFGPYSTHHGYKRQNKTDHGGPEDDNIVDAIKAKIPDISIEWLLYGSGDMYVSHPDVSPDVLSTPSANGQDLMLNFDAPAPVSPNSHQNSNSVANYQQGVKTTHPEYVREEIRLVDKEPRRVTEIRVYYDDQTYETFVPAKK